MWRLALKKGQAWRPGVTRRSACPFFIIYKGLRVRIDRYDRAVRVVVQLRIFDAAQMVDAAGERGVVVEQIPFALELDDRMVRRPADDRRQDDALVRERPVRVVADGVDQLVRRARRVRQIVLAAKLVHPRPFEIAPVLVARLDRLAVLVQNLHLARRLRERQHVAAQPGDARSERGRVRRGLFAFGIKGSRLPFLELAAPQAAEVHVRFAVVVDQHGRVDAEAAGNVVRLGLERARRLVAHRDADPEIPLKVARGEVEVVFAVLERRVRRPHLLARPRHVAHMQRLAVVDDRRIQIVHGQHMVVFHLVLVAVVVRRPVMLEVVGRINVQLALENMRRRIRRVNMSDERLFRLRNVRHDDPLSVQTLALLVHYSRMNRFHKGSNFRFSPPN